MTGCRWQGGDGGCNTLGKVSGWCRGASRGGAKYLQNSRGMLFVSDRLPGWISAS